MALKTHYLQKIAVEILQKLQEVAIFLIAVNKTKTYRRGGTISEGLSCPFQTASSGRWYLADFSL